LILQFFVCGGSAFLQGVFAKNTLSVVVFAGDFVVNCW
jgi:hypothetical protein